MAGPVLQNARVTKRWGLIGGGVVFLIILLFATNHYRTHYAGELAYPNSHAPAGHSPQIKLGEFVKPPGVSVIGFIFFGRRDRVELLKCYLERNLVDNGGWLDEVHWLVNTRKQDDLDYLEELLTTSARYKKVDLTPDHVGDMSFKSAWDQLERGKIYVKIDDDVVWFADDTIPRVVTTKFNNPQYAVVSANVANSPLMGWVHYHMGAIHPYLPEFGAEEPMSPINLSGLFRTSWKYTDYPPWEGPGDYYLDLAQDPPYDGHRWLRLQNDSEIHRTPAASIQYDTWGTGLQSWAIAAQEHYSFLENLLDDRLDLYKWGKPWVTDYQRLSINFIAVWADEILDNLPITGDDEEWLTTTLPRKLKKSVVVDSDALAVHFTFGPQRKAQSTDLLGRYRDYSVEHACARRF